MILELVWSPKRLAVEAAACSTIRAALAGYASAVCLTLLPLAASGGSIAEPYRDLTAYIGNSVGAIPVSMLLLSVVWSFPVLFLWIALAGRTNRARIMRRIVFLGPVTVLLPGMIWSLFAALNVFADPSAGFYGPGGKPEWLTSIPVRVLGNPLWVIAGFVCLGLRWKRAFGRVDLFIDPPECRRCGYNLTGNISAVCPECGRKV